MKMFEKSVEVNDEVLIMTELSQQDEELLNVENQNKIFPMIQLKFKKIMIMIMII